MREQQVPGVWVCGSRLRVNPTMGDSSRAKESCVEKARALAMVGCFPPMMLVSLLSSQPPSASVALTFMVLHLEPEDLGSALGPAGSSSPSLPPQFACL